VRLTGHHDAYYSDHRGAAQEFVSAAKYGYLFQGQRYSWQKQRRGTPSLDLPPSAFVTFIENHDQVANSLRGDRVHRLTSPGRLRAMTALLLLGPGTPMLFQGQEFASSRPFLYFADHNRELATAVRTGRQEFLAQFRTLAVPDAIAQLPDPSDPDTFQRCKLDFADRRRHAGVYALHRDLIRLRRDDPVFSNPQRRGVDGAVLSRDAFLLRYFGPDGDDRLMIVNFGCDLHHASVPEPLIAPPLGRVWELMWTSEHPRYGGLGTPPVETDDGWYVPGEAAVVMRAAAAQAV
jgi:maltooligosyltrehalose trehalohydrolase